MSIVQAIALGLLQGATEFLPVSSSGHLALLQHLWSMPSEARLALAASLHVGTALAVVVYFRRRLWKILVDIGARDAERRDSGLRMAWYMVLGSIPAGAVGLLMRGFFDRVFTAPTAVGALLLVTGAFLLATRFVPERGRSLCWWIALTIGGAQAVAILPGISRSGATIAAALFLGMRRQDAFDHSFLLSIPVVIGAAVVELAGLETGAVGAIPVLLGICVAFAAGIGALLLLQKAVVGRRLHWFSAYCAVVGVVVLLVLR